MVDLLSFVALFWVSLVGLVIAIICWKQVLVIFGIPLGLFVLVALPYSPEGKKIVGNILFYVGLPILGTYLICIAFGVFMRLCKKVREFFFPTQVSQ
jgi:TRAP-type C4-dicarboxylate transport system permease small subunit